MVVAERSLTRGEAITSDDVRVETWPQAVVPSGAVGELDQAVGEIVVEPVRADEPVALSRLGSHQASRGRLGLTGDEVAVALVGGLALPPLEIDDRVELYPVLAGTPGGTSGETVAASGTSGGRAVEGRIVSVSPDGIERSVTVAVPRPAVAALIEAQAMGVVEIVLVG